MSPLQSLPGILAVKRVNGVPTVFPAESGDVSGEENLLRTVYDMRPAQVQLCAMVAMLAGGSRAELAAPATPGSV